MLLPSYFIIDINRFDELPEDIQLPDNAFLSFRITSGNIHHIGSFYQKLYLSQRRVPFTLLIQLNDGNAIPRHEFEKNIGHLVSISFHYAYRKVNGDNPLFLFESTTQNAGSYITTLRKELTGQGYNSIETIIIDNSGAEASAKENKTLSLYPGKGSLSADYLTSLKKITSSGNAFFFFLEAPGNIKSVLETIGQAELNLQQEAGQTWSLLKENQAMAVKQQELEVKVTILQEKLESLTSYHLHANAPESRYKKQVTELQEFYNTEYEVLPLWFKRLGHIVKVLTGKRTFKSLYNDNVKKYKANNSSEN